MRAPADLPRRPSVGARSRVGLVVLAVALFLLLTSLRGIAGFYTEYLWFDSLDFAGVFTGVLAAKIALGVIFTAVFFALLYVNLLIADRLAPTYRPVGPEEEVIERYRELVGGRTSLVRVVVSALFAIIAGAGVSGQWRSWILFTNAQSFGVADPQFGEDIGFYVFRLPFLTFVVDWAFASVIIIAIVTAVAHYLNGGIRAQAPSQRVSREVKGHLSVLLGLLALIRAIGYYLARYELNFSTRGAVEGATYTDVNAQLPALELLILISLAAFVLFIVNIRRQGWVLPALGVGLWAIVAVVVGGIVPAFVQRFQVHPQQLARERPFIARNIEATRDSYNLDAVDIDGFSNEGTLTAEDLIENADIIRNIRLWDPEVLLETYRQVQGVRDFYEVRDVDVDRYEIEGEKTQVMVSTRELDTSGVPQTSWEARTLAYTHGYGVIVSPANSKRSSGRPAFLLADIPVRESVDIPLVEPALYVGEGLDGYVITSTDRREIDFQNVEGETQFREYAGADGVGVGSVLRRAAFALRFGDINPLISRNLRDDSKILFKRDVEERVSAIAPFLRLDADPYPAVIDGRVVFIVDAYTTSSNYPYAQSALTGDLDAGSGLQTDFNYVRNSVKAVVDAYDGTVTFYVIDVEDPVIRAYRQAFPELFTGSEEIPEDLAAHFRYPEDLFRVQTNMWGAYHVDEPDTFLDGNDRWDVAQAPGNEIVVSEIRDQTTGLPIGPARAKRFEPYYQLLRLPDSTEQQFVMVRPFVPASDEDNRPLLTAFMTANSDPGSYGELRSFVLPRSDLPDGPSLIGGTIAANPDVARLQTLLGTQGSELAYGNLLIVPIDQELLYVRPLYVAATSNPVPELERVIVVYDGKVEVAETLQGALVALFGAAPDTLEDPIDTLDNPAGPSDGLEDPEDPEDPGTEPTPDGDIPSLLAAAAQAFDDAQLALDDGDLGLYQVKVAEARDLVQRASEAAGAATTTIPEDVTA